MSLLLLLKASGGTPIVVAEAHGRAHSRSTAVRAAATTTGAAQGRAHSRSTARIAEIVTGVSRGRGRGRAKALAIFLRSGATVTRGARGRSTALGNVAGTIVTIANTTDFLEMSMPTPPTQFSEVLGVTRTRRSISVLGKVTHLIVGPSGETANPIIGEWSSEDDLFGGYGAAVGVIDRDEFVKNRPAYVQGSTWYTHHAESGQCVWAGRLMDPDIHQNGTISLTGRGWGQILLNRPQREPVLYARFGTEGWVDANAEIGNFGDNEFDGTVSADGGSLKFQWDADPDRTDKSQTLTMQFSMPGVDISRIQFYLTAKRDAAASTGFDMFVYSGRLERFDAVDDFRTVYGQEDILVTGDIGTRYNVEYDVPLNQDNSNNGGPGTPYPYLSPNDMVAIGIGRTGTGITNGLVVQVRDIRVIGEPLTEAECSVGQMVKDQINRLGLATDYIENTGPDILPYETVAGAPVSEALAFACLLSKFRFVVRGERPICYFTPPHDKRWFLLDEHHELDLVSSEMFDTILIPYALGTDSTIAGYRRVRLDPSPLERHNNYGALDWPFPIRSRQTTGSPFGIDDQRAEDLGISILKILSKPRQSGQGRVTEVVDEYGVRNSARMIQAGDKVRGLTVTKVRQSDNAVDLEFDSPLNHFLERLQAKRQLQHDRKVGMRR